MKARHTHTNKNNNLENYLHPDKEKPYSLKGRNPIK